jgi:hypothetical protein
MRDDSFEGGEADMTKCNPGGSWEVGDFDAVLVSLGNGTRVVAKVRGCNRQFEGSAAGLLTHLAKNLDLGWTVGGSRLYFVVRAEKRKREKEKERKK